LGAELRCTPIVRQRMDECIRLLGVGNDLADLFTEVVRVRLSSVAAAVLVRYNDSQHLSLHSR